MRWKAATVLAFPRHRCRRRGTAWSETYRFTVTDDLPRFVTPVAERFFYNLPVGHPRLYAYLDQQAEAARGTLSTHPEYKSLKSRANTVLRQDFTGIATFYRDKTSTENLNNYTNYLFQAYYLTCEENYADKMLEILSRMIACPPTDSQLFASNFITTNIALAYIRIYDLLYDRLPDDQRTATEEMLMKISRYCYKAHLGSQENNLYDSHFWQQNMRVLFQTAICSTTRLPTSMRYAPCWSITTNFGRRAHRHGLQP